MAVVFTFSCFSSGAAVGFKILDYTIRYCMIYIYVCVCVCLCVCVCVCMYVYKVWRYPGKKMDADFGTYNPFTFFLLNRVSAPRPQTLPGNPPKLAQEWSASLGVAKLLEYPKKGPSSHRCGHKNTAYGSTKSGFCPGNKLQTVQISGSSQCSCPCDSSVGLPLSSHWRALNPLQYLQKPRFSNI